MNLARSLLVALAVTAIVSTSVAQTTDPDGANALNQQVIQLYGQRRYEDAVPIATRVLAMRETARGPDHPEVANSLNNLADLYYALGRYPEAEPLLRRALAIREKAFGQDHPSVATTLNNLAFLYDQEGRYAEAEPLYKRGLEIREKALGPNHPDVATSLNNLAALYRERGRDAEAEPLYKRALAIRETALGPDHPSVATSLNNLAVLYRDQGRDAEAEPLYKRALAVDEKTLGADHPSVASFLNNLAVLYHNQGRDAEAEPLHERALAIREKALGPTHLDVAESLNNLAALRQDQGRHADAEPLYARALAIRETALGPDHPLVANSLNNLAALYRDQGRHAEAEPPYKRALAIQEKALGPNHPSVATSLNNLAVLYRDQGRYADALAPSTRAAEIMEGHLRDNAGRRSGGAASERRQARIYFLRNIEIMAAAAANDPSPGDIPQRTFHVAQLAQVSSAGEAVAGMAARFASGSDALAAVVRDRQDAGDRYRRLDAAVVKASGKPPAERDTEAERRLRADLDETGRRLDALDLRIAKDFPAYAELSAPKPLNVEAVQALLAADEALLVYLADGTHSWLWAVRHDQIAFYKIALGAKALAAEVTALRDRLDPERNPDLKPFPALRAYALHQKILAPAASLIGGARHILIVPDGALQSLPIGVLVTEPPTTDPLGPENHRDIAWFAKDHAITVLPSVSSLRALRTFAGGSRAPAPFAGVGNPVLIGPSTPTGSDHAVPETEVTITEPTVAPPPENHRGFLAVPHAPMAVQAKLFRGSSVNVQAVRELTPLPETAEELRAIGKALGASERDLYLAERATEPLIRRAGLDRYRVIAFATHGLMSGDLGLGEPALVLTPPAEPAADDDGLLTASKIATMKFNADWVVLSACNTAAGDGTPDAGGLSGLAKAFFYAGAKSLLVSNWSVPSLATVKLTTGAVAALAENPSIGRAEALRRAEMAMLDPSNPPEFSHPLVWAPFILAGEGGAGR